MKFASQSIKAFGELIEASGPQDDLREINVADLRGLIEKKKLIVLRGFKGFTNTDEFCSFCEQWGEISLWPFGKVLELIEQEQPEDHIFDNSYVPLHWDGMYRQQVPEFQIFHCVSAPGQNNGGRTTFSNTSLLLERATEKQINDWSEVTATYEREMEFYHSKTQAPIVTQHPTRDHMVIRYSEPPSHGDDSFVNHPEHKLQGAKEGFNEDLLKALYAPENFYAHEWQTGDVVISDNYTLLHGREAFTSGAPRHLRRVHVLGQPPLDNLHLVFHK